MKWRAILAILVIYSAFESSVVFADDPPAPPHWAYQPIDDPPLPPVKDMGWARSAIDRFVLHQLEAHQLAPSSEADRNKLIRRLSLDLVGLPPTPQQVRRFIEDPAPDAYEKLVDRLLSSPHYAERWARIWLDLCHYGDTDGYLTDQLRPFAWRYRDWLIEALNADLPFDQFTMEQLAGDLLPGATLDQKIATGFLRQTLSNREGGAEPEEFRVKQVVDRTEILSTTWLGLTVGCARCHDHFYDQISQNEFYELYACFDNADEVNIDAPLPGQSQPFHSAYQRYVEQRDQRIASIAQPLQRLLARWEDRLLQAYRNPGEDAHWDRQWELLGLVWGGNLGEGQLEGVEIVKLDRSLRTRRQQDDLLDYFLRTSGDIDVKEYKRLELGELRSDLDSMKSGLPPMSRAPTMRQSQTPRKTHVHIRGEFRDHAEQVHPSIPRAIDRNGLSLTEPGSERLDLARWLVSSDNPLTARVTVNRAWHAFFGAGIVNTLDDFGVRGERPTHPDLLDYLATQLIRNRWSVKALHREIVTSSTYRQSSLPRRDAERVDPANRLLARQNSFRVSAEMVRDCCLSTSGLLTRRLGGPGVKPPQPVRVVMEAFDNKTWEPSEGADRYRRGLYTFVIRTAPFAQEAIFDAPNPTQICAKRERSNTPLQALVLLNDEAFFEMARALGQRIQRIAKSDRERIDIAFWMCLSREPSQEERQLLEDLLRDYRRQDRETAREESAWTMVGSVMLNLHEFVTRD